jgi:MSHA biogenesis protein MshJ
MVRLGAYQQRFDALPRRERGLYCATLFLVVFFLWWSNLQEPQAQKHTAVLGEKQRLKEQLAVVNQQIAETAKTPQGDPNAPIRAELARLQKEAEEVNRTVATLTTHLVAPDRMAEVLREVIDRRAELSLTKLTGTEAESLIDLVKKLPQALIGPTAAGAVTDTASNDPLATTYRHGIQIEFSGSYLDSLAYLKELEGMPWGFFWDRIEFKVSSHPEAQVRVVLYTISLGPGWIGNEWVTHR